MIYIAGILDNKFVKVGYADNVERRIKELQTGCPFEIVVVTEIEGTLKQEKTLHSALVKAFARLRVPIPPNEWYPGNLPFMRDFIEYLKYGFDAGLVYAERFDVNVKQPGKKDKECSVNYKWPAPKKGLC